MVPYKTRGARRVLETRDCPPAAVPFPKKEARPAEKGSRYVGLAFILLGALLHNLAAEGALAKALLGGGGGDREGSRRVSEKSKFVLYRDLEAGYRWRLRSPAASRWPSPLRTLGDVDSRGRDTRLLHGRPPGRGGPRRDHHYRRRTIAPELLGLVHPSAEEGSSTNFE
jgi:hypothetical protein